MKKLDKSQMTPDQRMHYEMMLAKNATIIEILKEDERKKVAKEAATKAAKKTAKETAMKMKAKGMSNTDIQELTNLTIEEIESL